MIFENMRNKGLRLVFAFNSTLADRFQVVIAKIILKLQPSYIARKPGDISTICDELGYS